MKNFKALISKWGTILSITASGEHQNDIPSLHLLPGSRFPDVIYVSAGSKEEAEEKVKDLLQKLEAKDKAE